MIGEGRKGFSILIQVGRRLNVDREENINIYSLDRTGY